jgi:hypothetical protein
MLSGELARLAGVSTDTLRHYERAGGAPSRVVEAEVLASMGAALFPGVGKGAVFTLPGFNFCFARPSARGVWGIRRKSAPREKRV